MKNSILISDLFKKVWKAYWNKPRFIESGHAKNVLSNYQRHIEPVFGHLEADKITRAQVRLWQQELADTPIAANRAFEVLSRLYSFAYEFDWLLVVNPCSKIKKLPEKKRGRYANEEEIKKIFSAIEKYKDKKPVECIFLQTVLFCGARPLSLCKIYWKDLVGNTLTFNGKSTADSGEKETLVIPNQIVDLWKSLPLRDDGLIFGPVNYRLLWEKIRAEIGASCLWARDLRRTFATVGMSGGISMGVISELLNHKDTQTTKVYAKLNQAAKIEASSAIADRLNSIIKGSA